MIIMTHVGVVRSDTLEVSCKENLWATRRLNPMGLLVAADPLFLHTKQVVQETEEFEVALSREEADGRKNE